MTTWIFEGKILNHSKNPTTIQVNLHSNEAPQVQTGAIIEVDYELRRVRAMLFGRRAEIAAHRCVADALELISERSDEAHPEAFEVRSTEFIRNHNSFEIRLEGRVGDALTALVAHFGDALGLAFSLDEIKRARR